MRQTAFVINRSRGGRFRWRDADGCDRDASRSPNLRQRAAVFLAAQFFQRVEDRAEDVGFVIGDFCVGKIREVFRALDDAGDALKTHAGVHMLRRQRRKRASGLALNWMKTRFQISMQRASPLLTKLPLVSPVGVRSTWSSEQGRTGRFRPSSRNYLSCCRGQCGSRDRDRRQNKIFRPMFAASWSNSRGCLGFDPG